MYLINNIFCTFLFDLIDNLTSLSLFTQSITMLNFPNVGLIKAFIPSSQLQPLLIYAVNVATGKTSASEAPLMSDFCVAAVHVEAMKDSLVPFYSR